MFTIKLSRKPPVKPYISTRQNTHVKQISPRVKFGKYFQKYHLPALNKIIIELTFTAAG